MPPMKSVVEPSARVSIVIGTVPAVILGGIGTLVVTALWAWWFPALRKIDRLDETVER